MKYTFSNREKVLVAVLGVILVAALWYRFVFVSVNDRLTEIQSQEATAADTITMDTARLQRRQQMLDAIAEFKAQGIEKRTVPAYNNLENVMDQLHAALAAAASYDIAFDDLVWTSDGLIARGVSLTYAAGDYNVAKSILVSLYGGAFPCQVDSLALTDSSGSAISSPERAQSAVSVTAHLTYFEEVTPDSPTKGLPEKPSNEK